RGRRRQGVLCCALLLGACGDDSTGGPGGIGGIGGVGGGAGIGGAGGSGGMVADLSGTAIVNYVTDSGETQRPEDLSVATIQAVGLDVNQMPQTITGSGDATGHFMIAQVPDGFFVQAGSVFSQVRSMRTLDLGSDQLGRPDVTFPTMTGTDLVLDMQGMTPWAAGDDLQLVSSNSGTVVFLLTNAINPPAPAATDLAAFTVDW